MFLLNRPSNHRRIPVVLMTLLSALTSTPSNGESTEQTYVLQTHVSSRRAANVRVKFVAEGHLKAPGDKSAEQVAMHVSAELAFQDRFLGDLQDSQVGGSLCAARYYQNIDVQMTVGEQTMQPNFRESRKLIGLCRTQDGGLDYFSPDGTLTRDELDLIRLPGDRQALPLLLPKHPVRIDSVWKLKPAAMAAILALDAVGDCDVQSTLTGIEQGFARVEFEGVVHGAVAGVATEVTLKGRYYFYMRHGEFASMQMVTHEQRDIGHINPGVDITARLKMRLEPQSDAGYLSDSRILPLYESKDRNDRKLHYESTELGLAFDYDADWYATAEDRQAVVFRQLMRGDLIAQCNVSKLPNIKKGKALTLSQFEKDIRENLDKNFGSFVTANETTSERGYLIYRVEALGTASSIPVRWIYYLLSDTTGRRVAIVFTMERDQETHFNDADSDWIRKLEFLSFGKPEASGQKDESGESSEPINTGSPVS